MVTKVCKKTRVGKRQVMVGVHRVTSIVLPYTRHGRPDSDAKNTYKSTRLLESWFLPNL
jgi:hypothetical protein